MVRFIEEEYSKRMSSGIHMEPHNDEESLTVPDQSLSIRDILENFTRGIAPIQKKGYYADDEINQAAFEDDSEFDDITNDPSYYHDIENRVATVLEHESELQDLARKEEEKKKSADPVESPDPVETPPEK